MIANSNQEALLNTPPASSPSNSIEAPSYGSRFAHWLVRNYKESLMVLLCAAGGYAHLKSSSRASLGDHKINPALPDSQRARSSFLQGIDSTEAGKPTVSYNRIECLFDHQSFQRFMDTHFKSVDYPEWYQNFMQQEDACSAGKDKSPVTSDHKTMEEYEKPCQQKPGFLFHSKPGTGDFNPVYRITTEDGQPFAIKVANDTGDIIEEFFTHARLLAHTIRGKSGTEYLARIIGISSAESPLKYLITEAFNSTLPDFLKGLNKAPDKHHIKSIFRQMLKGVQAIHNARLIHNDLKPDNMFISSKGDIKIANLEAAQPIGWVNDLGTIEYRAPEKLLYFHNDWIHECFDNQGHTTPCAVSDISSEKTDNWSLGVIFAQLFFGDPHLRLTDLNTLGNCRDNFEIDTEDCISNHLSRQQELITTRMRGYDQDAADLFSRLTESSPTERITLSEALQHPYMQEDDS